MMISKLKVMSDMLYHMTDSVSTIMMLYQQ